MKTPIARDDWISNSVARTQVGFESAQEHKARITTRQIRKRFTLMATLALLPLSVSAHHGVSGQFDMSQSGALTGTITRVRLVNPHAYVYFDVADKAGNVTNRRCELTSGSLLKRSGWTEEMFVIGSEITIQGSPDRDDPTTCHMNQITFANGVTANRESTFGDDGTLDIEDRRIEREDGTPNLNGTWAVAAPRERRRERESVSLSPAGMAAVANASPDQNPRFQCQPTNIVMDWVFNGMVNRIDQTNTDITLTYGFMDLVRTIHLDVTAMPDDWVPSRAGFSIGEWEGDTLVVTTTGFDEGWIMAPIGGRADRRIDEASAADRPERPERLDGSERADRPERPGGGRGPQPVKNSVELTVTERFTLNEDGTVLRREYAFIDPSYLDAPIVGMDEVALTSDAYEPYACDDLTNERAE